MSGVPNDVAAYNRALIEQFRRTGTAPEGRALLLLTTTGARTGQPRTTPMMFIRDDGHLYVVASNAGAPRHPDWFHNLVAHPTVTVEIEGETYEATANVPEGTDREQLFDSIADRYPFFRDHQSAITRRIPVVELVRS